MPNRKPGAGSSAPFSPELFRFLRQLDRNNNRDWFEANKERYLEHVRDPMLAFIANLATPLRRISPHLVADPRPVGGSMFRIHRDVRFAKDKRPYKTSATARLQHESAKDVHAPGFYLGLGPKSVTVGAGIWHPDGPALARIRGRIVEEPAAWKRVSRGKRFLELHALGGESLVRPPRGFDPEHPFIEDLKRKDYVSFVALTEADACSPDFQRQYLDVCKRAKPFVGFIAESLGLPF